MKWSDDAYILSLKPFGESSFLVSVLSRGHGKHAGLARGARSGKNRSIYQVGNFISVTWQARLSDNLGMFTAAELKCATCYPHFNDELRFAALSSMFELLDAGLNERELYPKLFEQTKTFIDAISEIDVTNEYWQWEHLLLQELGFGIEYLEPNTPEFKNMAAEFLLEHVLSPRGRFLPLLRSKLVSG